jgi:hypothetical protein
VASPKRKKDYFFSSTKQREKRKEMQAKEQWRILWKHVFFFALLRCLDMTPERFVINKAAPIIDP